VILPASPIVTHSMKQRTTHSKHESREFIKNLTLTKIFDDAKALIVDHWPFHGAVRCGHGRNYFMFSIGVCRVLLPTVKAQWKRQRIFLFWSLPKK